MKKHLESCMNQYPHLNKRLAKVWDECFHHLESYDFSLISKVFVDDIAIGTNRTPACIYRKGEGAYIVLAPYIFEIPQYQSDYTGILSDKPLHFVLLHEIAHYLQNIGELPIESDSEREADEFADTILKEMS